MSNDSKIQIAKRYSLALYMAAEEKGNIHKVHEDITKLLDVIEADASLIEDLANPLWSVDSKHQAIHQISKKLGLSQETMRCLDIVVSNNRTKETALILEGFKRVYLKKHNITAVKVFSAKKLTTAQDKKLKDKLEKKLNTKVLVKYKIDPEILGGLKIEYRSKMIDDSLQGKLNKLAQIMKGA